MHIGGLDGILRFRRVISDEMVYQIELPRSIYCLKLAHNSLLITAGQGNIIRIWDASSFFRNKDGIFVPPQILPVRVMHNTNGYSIYALELVIIPLQYNNFVTNSQNSNTTISFIVTGGRENMVRFWDIYTGKEVFNLKTHGDVVVHSISYLINQFTSITYFQGEERNEKMLNLVPTIFFRLYFGCDNGSIFCRDIACDTGLNPNYILSIVNGISNANDHTAHLTEGFDGVYYGHENVISSLLLLTPFKSELPHNYDEFSRTRCLSTKSIMHQAVLVSTSRDISDVRLWRADFNFKKCSSNSSGGSNPLLCRLVTDHMGPVTSLGIWSRNRQSTLSRQYDQNERVFFVQNILDKDFMRNADMKVDVSNDVLASSHLITRGSDNKVCVWDIYQLLKDLHWEKIKWFVLITKQIRIITNFQVFCDDCKCCRDCDHQHLINPTSKFDNDVLCATSVKKENHCESTIPIQYLSPHKSTTVESEEIKKMRLILTSIVSRQDILSVVSSFLL